MMELRDKDYIGDGVYIGHDGWHVVMYTDRQEGRHWIALEPGVIEGFMRYVQRITKHEGADHD